MSVHRPITAWLQHDEALGIETLCLYVHGLKTKAQQGCGLSSTHVAEMG